MSMWLFTSGKVRSNNAMFVRGPSATTVTGSEQDMMVSRKNTTALVEATG